MVTSGMLIGMGVGAAVAFMADPRSGRRRRALTRDQFVRAGRKTRDALDATARDIGNRTTGMIATARGTLMNEDIDDRRLIERVRASLGRASSHPRAIDVESENCVVTLRGHVLAAEHDDVVTAAAAVRGVQRVASELQSHESAEGVPWLQGERNVAGPTWDILQRNWAPATQALVAMAGIAATGLCLAAYARR
jgi:gas vesicle protein